MAKIKIEDLQQHSEADAPLSDSDLDSVVGGAYMMASTSYFQPTSTYISPTFSPTMPLPGGSLSTSGGLFGVRG